MIQQKTIYKHLILFILTIGTTFLIGLGEGVAAAAMYSGALMSILLCHEMGHYLMARKYGVPATLPYFIPMPIGFFGTMGAIIFMKGNIPNRRALLDIGAAGPLAGLAVAIPVIFIGVKLSSIQTVQQLNQSAITLGDSYLFSFLTSISIGKIPEGYDLMLHPLAYAGWVGLLVTAINLLPISQLDGGHVLYALFGSNSRWISRIVYLILVYVFLFKSSFWLVFLILLAIFHKHPPTFNDTLPLDFKRYCIGFFTLGMFIISFTPKPFAFFQGLIPFLIEHLEVVL